MKTPRWIGARKAPKTKFLLGIDRPESGRAARIAKLSAATVMVLGIAVGSAFFVDFLADRTQGKGAASAGTRAVITASVPETAAATSASLLVDSAAATEAAPEQQPRPARTVGSSEPVAIKPVPIEVTLPDPEVLAKVVVAGSERAVDATGESPVLQFNEEQAGANPAEPFDALTTHTPSPAPRKKTSEEVAALQDTKAQTDSSARAARSQDAVPTGSARILSSVNMRSGPNKGSGVLGVVPAGSQVKVISCEGWCQISHEDRTGWVYKSFLTMDTAPAPSPAPEKAEAAPQEPPAPAARGVRSPRLQN